MVKIKFFIDFRHFIASGSQDGILAIYALETGECLCQKQLFGRIEVVKAKDDILATAHFGKDYDMGCITVRRIVSASDLPVIFSIYQVSKYCTVDSRYSLIANSGKTRISGFFQITKTKMNFM